MHYTVYISLRTGCLKARENGAGLWSILIDVISKVEPKRIYSEQNLLYLSVKVHAHDF